MVFRLLSSGSGVGIEDEGKFVMRLRYLGKTSGSGKDGCPALYATDRGTFVVQGTIVTDAQAIGDLHDGGPDEAFVEVPADVLRLIDRA